MQLSEFNAKQRECITYSGGPLMIIAGAGTGKTKLLTGRMAYRILEEEYRPQEIVAITYTNMAAGQMRDRMSQWVAPESLNWVRTFHSLCYRILKEAPPEWQINGVASGKIRLEYVTSALLEAGLKEIQYPPAQVLSWIDQIKKEIDPESRLPLADRNLAAVYLAYQAKLKQTRMADFSDLIHLTYRMFGEMPDLLSDFQKKIREILVDEFQDLDPVQFALLKRLSGSRIPVVVVGDDDQSIYGFRGSHPHVFKEFFEAYLPHVVHLDLSYRCTRKILDSAQLLISNNTSRVVQKTLKSAKSEDGAIQVKGVQLPEEEVKYICSEIKEELKRLPPSHIAVLARQKSILEPIRVRLAEMKIPVATPAYDFYRTAEFRTLYAWMQVVCLPHLDMAFEQAILSPVPKVDEGVVGILKAGVETKKESLYESALSQIGAGTLPLDQIKGLAEFLQQLVVLADTATGTSVSEFVRKLIGALRYEEYLAGHYGPSRIAAHLKNLDRLIAMAREYEGQNGSQATLLNFVNELALGNLHPPDSGTSGVMVLTFHSAKGLEFESVYLAGCEQGIIPHFRGNIEEERRLMYVASTRAISRLSMSWVEYRSTKRGMPSLFLSEMKEAFGGFSVKKLLQSILH